MKKNARSKGAEWVCGVGRMPAYVTGEGEPYRPELLVWMLPDGPVLGFDTAKPGELLADAGASFRRTTLHPAVGRPHSPARVRVASPELARALREALPAAVELVCAPTPEVDAVLGSMRERMGHRRPTEPSYLAPDIGPAAVASFFRAAAGLFRGRPWDVIPDDESVLSVTIESLGVRDAAMVVTGQLGESRAVLLFSGLEDFERFLEAAAAVKAGEEPVLPEYFAIHFQRGAELPAALRKEIAEHGWEVAGADAYAWVAIVDEDMVARPPTAKELTLAEAIALALPQALADGRAVRDAWRTGVAFRHTLRVQTHAGEVELTVGGPYDDTGRYRPPYDVLGRLAELASRDDVDPDEQADLEEELVRRFAESPEGVALTDVDDCHYVIDLAASFMGATVATLQAAELREILFEILPARVTVDPAEARAIIETNRAFYAFLKREFGLPQADACLRVLGGDAVQKLEAALSDPRSFGMAKSVVQAGSAAGFDMKTKEGIEAWMRDLQERPLSVGTPAPLGRTPAAAPKAARAKKDKRKAARKARKKNR